MKVEFPKSRKFAAAGGDRRHIVHVSAGGRQTSRWCASPAETESRRDIALARPSKGRPMTRIVIVGNDNRTSDILAGIANEFAPHVHRCADGLEALAVLRAHPDCDLVVTGLHLPHLGGLSLLRAIRNDERIDRVPVIVMDNASCASEVNEVLAAGATGFLGMPFSMGAARGILAEYLGTGLTAAV